MYAITFNLKLSNTLYHYHLHFNINYANFYFVLYESICVNAFRNLGFTKHNNYTRINYKFQKVLYFLLVPMYWS